MAHASLVQHLRGRIDLGTSKPGAVIGAAGLVATCGASRPPEREAILHLEAVGLVRRLPRKGATIFRPTVAACEADAASKGDGDPDACYQCDLRLREAEVMAASNAVPVDFVKTNARRLLAHYRARYRYAGSIAVSVREHRAIARLKADRDSAGAEAVMQGHVQFDQVTAMDLMAALS